MTNKERVLATLRGESTDVLPFIPRLDNWFYANHYSGTLPDKYKKATLREMADDLGFGFHSIIPNFEDWRIDDGDLHVGLGIYDLNLTPWRVEFHNVNIKHERNSNGELRTTYETPKGNITSLVVHNDSMKKNGITLYAHKEYPIKSSEDYDAIAYLFENAEVIPDYARYADYQKNYIGDRGVAVALSAMWASPGHYLIKELMSFEDFYLENFDDKDAMDGLIERIRPFCGKLFDAAVNSPAEVILSGANYDFSFTAPPVFEEYIAPELLRQSDVAHSMGKFIATHTDGDNTQLTELYMKSGFDIADSICPAPMTNVPLKHTRDVFNGTKTIWGGIPSIATLPESMSDKEFYVMMDQIMKDIGHGDHIILSVADTLPPAADFERVLYIKKLAEAFGPIKMD